MADFGGSDRPVTKFGEGDTKQIVGEVLSESLESVGRRALDAFSLGFGDEIIAAAQSAFGDQDYREALAASEPQTQAAQQQAREASIFGIDPLDVAGLATTGGATFQLARNLPGVSRLPGVLRSGLGGATVGGTAAAGTPGTLEERAGRVPYGATAGALIAPAAGLAARGVGATVGAARDIASRFLPGAQEAQGLRQVGRAMDRAGLDPQVAQQTLTRYGPQAVMADLPGMRRLGQQSVELEGQGRALAEDVLRTRNLEQGPRVGRALRDAMEEQRDFVAVQDDLMRTRAQQSAPLYERLHQQTIQPTERMRNLLGRSSLRRAYSKARELATEDGFELPTYNQLVRGDADLTGMRTWDYIKRGLDEQAYLSRQPTSGMGPTMQGAVRRTRQELVEELDRLVPEYAETRAAYAGPSRANELMQEGRAIFDRRTPDEFIRDIRGLDEGEREFLRLGVVDEVINRIGNVSEARDAASAFWTRPNNQKKLAALFPRGENLTRFMDRMMGEQEATLTMREVMQQSRTAERQALADQYAIESAPRVLRVARQLARGDIGGAIESEAGEMARRSRVPAAQRDAAARVLFEQDPAQQARNLQRIDRARGIGPMVQGATAAGAAGGGAAAAGRNEQTRALARMLLGGS